VTLSVEESVAKVLANLDLDRAVQLVREVCRIPSVLGDEGPLAGWLVDSLRDTGFEGVEAQDVLPGRPNAIGQLDFGSGPRVVFTGHIDTKPESRGWSMAAPYSGDVIDGAVYGHGIMDMKAALACMLVAMEAVGGTDAGLAGTLAFAAVSDHMGDQRGSIAYFDRHRADLCVLGELTDNEIVIGHRGRYYFDVTCLGRSAHTCHKHFAVNANIRAAHAMISIERSSLKPTLEPWVEELFGAETFIVPGRVYGGLPPGGPSMIPDECVIRIDCRPQPGVSVEEVRTEIDRCLDEARAIDPDFDCRVDLVDVKAGYLVEAGAPVVRTMVDAVRDVRPGDPVLGATGWLGDTASFGAGTPTVIFGPGGEPVYCADEHLSIADIEEATKIYAAFATRALFAGG